MGSEATRAVAPWPTTAIAAAVLVRLVVGVHLYLADPLSTELVSDAAYYDRWARAIAAGETWQAGLPYWMPPLYPWLLGALYSVTGGAIAATLVVQGLVGVLGTVALAGLARRVLAPRAVAPAVWLWVLYAPLVLFEQRLLAVNAALPLVLLGLWAGCAAVERLEDGRRAELAALAAGLCMGLACLARPNLLVGPLGFAAGAAFDLVRARRRGRGPTGASALAALAVGALALAAPLAGGAAANLARSGQPVLVSANGGINFWFGNNERARGTFAAPGVEWGDIFGQRETALAVAARELGLERDEVDERRASAYWFGRGRAWIAEHPLDAALLAARKLAASLSSTEYGIQVVPAAVRESAPSLWLAPLPFGLVLALAVLSRGRGVRCGGALTGWVVAALAVSIAYFTYSRFRLPWYPALVLFAAAGLDALRRGGGARPGPAAWALALAALVVSFLPTEGAYPRQLRANALVDTSLAWERRGAERVAAARARGAGPGEVERLAAETLERSGRWLERALELVPGDAKALDEAARLAWQTGDERRAAELLERALATGVDYPPARRRLALLLVEATDGAVRDPARGEALLAEWLGARPPDAFGALELGLALGDALVRRAALEPDARVRLVELIAHLAPAHAGEARFEALRARAAPYLGG